MIFIQVTKTLMIRLKIQHGICDNYFDTNKDIFSLGLWVKLNLLVVGADFRERSVHLALSIRVLYYL